MSQTIVKVQRPFFPAGAPWLVYAEGKKDLCTLPDKNVPPHVRLQMGSDPKGYFFAELAPSATHWVLANRTEEQSW